MQRVESEKSDAMDVDGKEGESDEKESTGGRGKEAEEYIDMIRKMAQERVAARGGGGSGAGNARGSGGVREVVKEMREEEEVMMGGRKNALPYLCKGKKGMRKGIGQ
jgi:hypothetical protein